MYVVDIFGKWQPQNSENLQDWTHQGFQGSQQLRDPSRAVCAQDLLAGDLLACGVISQSEQLDIGMVAVVALVWRKY
jgi:hypothetical protein